MPMAVGEAEIGPPNPEFVGGNEIIARRRVTVEAREEIGSNRVFIKGAAESTPCEVLVDADGTIKRGKCMCGHFRKAGIRMGPCRHLLALRWSAMKHELEPARGAIDSSSWYDRLLKWAGNEA